MTDPVDLVPPRPRGRPMRKLDDAFSGTRSDRRCRECPKYDPVHWCPVQAAMRPPDAPACRYGLVLITSRRRQTKKGTGR